MFTAIKNKIWEYQVIIIWFLLGMFILFYSLYGFYESHHNPESNTLLGFFSIIYTLPLGTILIMYIDYIFSLFTIVSTNGYLQIVILWIITMLLSYTQWFILIPYLSSLRTKK